VRLTSMQLGGSKMCELETREYPIITHVYIAKIVFSLAPVFTASTRTSIPQIIDRSVRGTPTPSQRIDRFFTYTGMYKWM
jgi:hypothetical protein